jgi:hypothetical protein
VYAQETVGRILLNNQTENQWSTAVSRRKNCFSMAHAGNEKRESKREREVLLGAERTF